MVRLVVPAALLLSVGVQADVYMQFPPGSNNRLAEGGGNRNNNNRLMDTQNNAKVRASHGGSAQSQISHRASLLHRAVPAHGQDTFSLTLPHCPSVPLQGGYGYGGDDNNKAAAVKYMVASKLSAVWTSQHSCGSSNAECQIVLQYMCNDGAATPAGVLAATDNAGAGAGEGPLRDGTDGNAPDPNNPDADRGLHEPTSFYKACEARERNKGLYVSDQNLNGDDATKTRQNPNGERKGAHEGVREGAPSEC